MKRCGKPAAFIVVVDPVHPNYLCKAHGPEKVLTQLGLTYIKARPGDRCRQITDWKAVLKEILYVFFTTGSIPKVVSKWQELYKS